MQGPTQGSRSSEAAELCGITAAFATALLLAPALGGLVHGASTVLAVGVIAALSVLYGQALLRLLPLAPVVPRHLVAVVVGFCAVSVVHLTATVMLNTTALPALGVDIVGGTLLTLAVRRRGGTAAVVEGSSALSQALVLVACGALATLWARETVTAVPHAMATGTFPAWQDYFLHASEVAYMRDYPAFAVQSQYLTAVPQPLYHRGSYTMPAVLSALTGLPTLDVATAFWMPAGLLLCIVATWTFGAALAGVPGGLAAVIAAFLVPDASGYGFENHFLSFHWLLQMAAGSGFALALTLTALSVVVTATPERTVRALTAAMVLVLAGAAFRVHVSLLSVVMVVVLGVLTVRVRPTARLLAGLAVAVAAGLGVLVWMESQTLAPHILSGGTKPSVFFLSVHSQASLQPTSFTAWTQGRGELAAFAVGYPMMLAAGCGLWLAVLAVVWVSGGLRRLGSRVWVVPTALIVAHMVVVRLVPTPAHGDPTDFGHRPFVLIYVVVAALGAAGVAARLREWSGGSGRLVTAGLALAALAGLVVPWRDGAVIQQRWTPAYATIPVDGDTAAAAAFVRQQSAPGDEVLASREDPLAVIVALTERRGWLSRSSLYRSLGPEFAESADARAAEHASIAQATTFDEVKAFGARTGVDWYIADGAPGAAWPEAIARHSVFTVGGVRVYDLR
jgi:hypothetical protein